jgi:hypothetical protein
MFQNPYKENPVGAQKMELAKTGSLPVAHRYKAGREALSSFTQRVYHAGCNLPSVSLARFVIDHPWRGRPV